MMASSQSNAADPAMRAAGPDPTHAVDYDPFAGGELERVVPTTESQREIWLADQLGADASLSYNESVSLRFRGELDRSALQVALQDLVDRHDALRANVGPDGDTFCIAEARALPFEFHDFTAMGAEARAVALAERCRAAVDLPFSLSGDALFKAELLQMAENDAVLILTAHHIVCDGWSWWVLVRELAACYAARVQGQEPRLPEVETFADHALEQAAFLGSRECAEDERYWLSRLQGPLPTLDLPTDRPRPARRSFASSRLDEVLDAGLVASLRRTGAGRGASLFATLLGGFAATLGRLAGQERVVVGIPAAGQSVDGHDHLVGHCVNTLPLLFDLDMDKPAAETVDAAQSTLLDALEHQRYTFGSLLKKLPIDRDPSRLPLVSVLFNIDQALDHESAAFPGLELEFSSNARSHEAFEIFINAVQAGGELRLECQYNRDLFDADTIRRWLSAFRSFLADFARDPSRPLGSLSMVGGEEMQRLRALQPSPVPFDRDCGMHGLFERQCDRTPDRVAAHSGAVAVSYAELDARANRIAHLLRRNGAHRGTLVGIAVDRGIDMLATLLGILKTGAGYVPLDPGFPEERLAYMAGDAGLAALVTQSAHASRFDLRGRPVLALDALEDVLASMPAVRLPVEDATTHAESVAYVIYTSGSTGRPKGVQVPHRAVVNFIASMQREPGLADTDVLVAVTTLSFDIAVLELMLPLSVGAQVVLANRDTSMDGVALARLLEDSSASVMQATPATWRMLVETGWKGRTGFRALCGGEPLPADLASRLFERGCELWNLYGPTETTVWSTCARILPPAPGQSVDIHIGRPIDNTTVWIVDGHGALCPFGVPGEICIGGEGVTLGYLDRQELTAERFIEDRFSVVAGGGTGRGAAAPMYRTGDRGRWRPDGNLQHLGRMDFQVKIRGFRIELGEIENMLAGHPDVAAAVAMAREDRPGDVRLVAYVVARRAAAVDVQALLSHLRSTLPDYMIPQHLVVLDAIPLLPNGKIDRKSLPVPAVDTARMQERVAPRTELERKIADAMSQVLGQAEIGIHDDFFAVGGHSLLAAQLTTRLNRELGATLSLRSLFDGPTVAKLAAMIGDGDTGPAARREPIPRRADQGRAPLSLAQDRLRMLEAFNPGSVSYNTPSAHRLTGPLDHAKFVEAFNQLMQRQTVLRTSVEGEGDDACQVVHDSVDPGLDEVIDLSHLPREEREAELARRVQDLIETPFDDLSQAPLFRARLYRLGEEEHAFFFMPHHIIWDGWSFDLMYGDFSELYAALLEDRPPSLPELPVTYGDYAAWHRDWLQGEEYAGQVAFWREQLGRPNARGGRPQAFPTDKPRKRGMSGTSRSHAVTIDAGLTRALRATSRDIDVTMFVILLATYYAVLARMSGQHDLVVGTPVRGRNVSEVEGLMGYFTNLLPLRLDVDPERPFVDLVRDVRSVVLDSFASPDIRLEDLTRELSLRGDGVAGGSMLYQALFSFQDIRLRNRRWGNLDHDRIAVFQPGATEDLGLWFVESEDDLSGGLIYNAEILHDETALLLNQRYVEVLRSIVRDPTLTVAALTQFDDGQPDLIGQIETRSAATATDTEQGDNMATVFMNQAADVDPRIAYLAALWSELLGTSVEEEDNFFDIGGNSMLAVQMAERVRRDTGVRIRLIRLAAQSLAEIAADLPLQAVGGEAAATGVGARLMGKVRRLFGKQSMLSE